jgi:hypothetical protein
MKPDHSHYFPTMKQTSRKLLSILAAAIFAATTATAAPGARPGHEGRPAQREVRTYYQANVMPVLQQQRQKLEPQLSADDRAQLATYRTQLRTLREQGATLRRSFSSNGEAPAPGVRPELTEDQRTQLQALRTQTRTIMLGVGQMAQKYREPLAQLGQELQPQKEKWAADIQAIVLKNASPEQQQHLAEAAVRTTPGHRHGHGPGASRQFFQPTSFLLMEPAAASSGESSLSSTSFYPNPVTAASQFEYELKTAGPVTVELLDKNGNKLRTLVSEPNAEKGAHSQQLSLSDLPAGTYYYKVTTKAGSETKRFVKE